MNNKKSTEQLLGELATAREHITALEATIAQHTQETDRIKRLLQDSADVVTLLDLDGITTYQSPAMERVYGYSPLEMTGIFPFDYMHPEDATAMLEAFHKLLQRPEKTEIVAYRFRHKDGSWVHTESTVRNLLADPNVNSIVANSRDIGKRTYIEQELETTRVLLEAIMEQSPIPTVVASAPDMVIRLANTAAEEILGIKDEGKDRFLGATLSQVKELKTWKTLNPDGSPTNVEELPLALALQGQSTPNKEYRVLRKDGTQRWKLVSGAPIYDKSGELIAGLVVFPDITERKKAEEALARERDLLHTLMDNIPDNIYFKDCKSRFTKINRAQTELLGVDDPRQAIGKTDFDFFTLDHAQDAFRDEQKIVQTGQSIVDKVERIRKADGSFFWVSVTKAPIVDPEQRITGIVGISRDIDKRIKAEKALRRSGILLQSLLESLPQNVYSKDMEGRFTFVNRRYCETASKSQQDILGKTDYDLHPPELAQKYRTDDRQVIETGQILEIVEEHQPLDGKSTYVHVIKTPLYDPKGQAVGTLGIFWDITERKRAEEEILRLQHLLQNITDSMPSALVALDPDGQVLLWNPAAETLTGQTADWGQGHSLWQTCPPLSRYRDLFEQVLREGQVAHRHKERLAGEMGTTYRDVDVFPLIANDIEGAVLRIDDVTRRVQLEEMMLQSAKMASIGRLAAGVAHEINNPLGAIIQSAQMLQMAFDTQHPRTRQRLQACGVDPKGFDCYLQERGLVEYLAGIRTTGARAAKIVSDLLSFSHKTVSGATSHDLNQLVEQALALAVTDYDLKRKYDFRNIEIVRELAPDLPEIVCDGQQIQQVVLNLVRNAAQAMAGEIEGSDREYQPRLVLRTSLQEEIADHQSPTQNRGWVWLEVEDNGPGILEETGERLFEPFFTTKEVGEGTGLGLWLCWSIVVERHGGRIWVEPAKDNGSRFVVELPLAN